MKRTLDEWLGRALTPTQEPDAELVQGILEQAKETKHMEKRRFRRRRLPRVWYLRRAR